MFRAPHLRRVSLTRPLLLPQCQLIRPYSIKFPPPPSHYEKSTPRRFGKLTLLAFLLGASITYTYPLYTLGEKLAPLPDESDAAANEKYLASLESKLQSLPIVNKYRNDPAYVEQRGWNHLDTTKSGLSSFHGTLTTPGGIAIAPLSFHCAETGDDVVIVHVGRRLSGYPFLVHGGILGAISEEVFKSNVIKEYPNLTYDTLHTKNLNLNYKFPTFVNQFIVIKSSLHTKNALENTYSVSSDLSTLGGTKLIKAQATLVSDVLSAITNTAIANNTVTPATPAPTATSTKPKGWFW
jgi:hypothetical protein